MKYLSGKWYVEGNGYLVVLRLAAELPATFHSIPDNQTHPEREEMFDRWICGERVSCKGVMPNGYILVGNYVFNAGKLPELPEEFEVSLHDDDSLGILCIHLTDRKIILASMKYCDADVDLLGRLA